MVLVSSYLLFWCFNDSFRNETRATYGESLFYRRFVVIQRIYFYVLAFNAVERIKWTVFIFVIMLHFSYQYCIFRLSKRSFFFVLCMLWEMLWSEWFGGLTSLWRWCGESLVSPVHSLTFVYISGCDHLCLFSFFFKFLLQALLSALCLNLNLDRMYSFDLQWKWNNDKIRMVSKPVCVCLYWLSCVKLQSGLFSWTVDLAELQSLFGPVENKDAF